MAENQSQRHKINWKPNVNAPVFQPNRSNAEIQEMVQPNMKNAKEHYDENQHDLCSNCYIGTSISQNWKTNNSNYNLMNYHYPPIYSQQKTQLANWNFFYYNQPQIQATARNNYLVFPHQQCFSLKSQLASLENDELSREQTTLQQAPEFNQSQHPGTSYNFLKQNDYSKNNSEDISQNNFPMFPQNQIVYKNLHTEGIEKKNDVVTLELSSSQSPTETFLLPQCSSSAESVQNNIVYEENISFSGSSGCSQETFRAQDEPSNIENKADDFKTRDQASVPLKPSSRNIENIRQNIVLLNSNTNEAKKDIMQKLENVEKNEYFSQIEKTKNDTVDVEKTIQGDKTPLIENSILLKQQKLILKMQNLITQQQQFILENLKIENTSLTKKNFEETENYEKNEDAQKENDYQTTLKRAWPRIKRSNSLPNFGKKEEQKMNSVVFANIVSKHVDTKKTKMVSNMDEAKVSENVDEKKSIVGATSVETNYHISSRTSSSLVDEPETSLNLVKNNNKTLKPPSEEFKVNSSFFAEKLKKKIKKKRSAEKKKLLKEEEERKRKEDEHYINEQIELNRQYNEQLRTAKKLEFQNLSSSLNSEVESRNVLIALEICYIDYIRSRLENIGEKKDELADAILSKRKVTNRARKIIDTIVYIQQNKMKENFVNFEKEALEIIVLKSLSNDVDDKKKVNVLDSEAKAFCKNLNLKSFFKLKSAEVYLEEKIKSTQEKKEDGLLDILKSAQKSINNMILIYKKFQILYTIDPNVASQLRRYEAIDFLQNFDD